ncbi:FliH/SctL family protein [Paenibacillus pinihumi]|uniref:FliH/SctL family protein n=1 Tax=Paenibacillus pinihumi TaxID=669462 RepID=UPI000416790E|nr:FliH/SctL family protein [Paenibacillus pinihumi]
MSNLIKSAHVVAMEDLKKLQTEKRYAFAAHQESEQPLEHYLPTEEELQTRQLRDQIIEDAESYAKERLEQAAAEAEQMLQAAKEQIGQWWSERRAEDEQLEESLRKQGYDQGYQEGLVHAEEDNSRQWAQQIEDAKALLEQAYRSREEIIQEAEPFLVELSCSISEKIIGKQLTAAPDWALELVVKSLSRRREQGMIALCVAPDQLAFMEAAREELSLAIDSQAELQILPDVSVKGHGCVIRSMYGSIDARIDTQLEEIKRELIQLAIQGEERRGTDEQA